MIALKKLLGHDDKFFDLLEASAVEAETTVQHLMELLKNRSSLDSKECVSLSNLYQARKKEKRITEEITELLCKTFVTPLEREDIEALSMALYRIPKMVEKFIKKYLTCMEHIITFDFSRQMNIMEETTKVVTSMVKDLREKRLHLDKIKEQNGKLHHLEGEADKVMLELLKDLYSGAHDPLKVIIIMDLYETLEKGIDRCRDAGNIIFQIILKYS